jgi:hypothetical protein
LYASALDFAGLYTFPNPLAKVPVGACLQADNLTANKDGTGDCRRGLGFFGSALTIGPAVNINQWFAYQNALLNNDSAGGLWFDSVPTTLNWSKFTGPFLPPLNAIKMRGNEANKNFYLTSAAGILKLPAFNVQPVPSGVPSGLDGTAVLAGAGAGFLGAAEQCAYQIVFGYTDLNGNFLLGAPSQRINIINATGATDNVTLTFTVPQGLSTNYFYQVYRTVQTAYNVTPSLNVPPGAEPLLAAQQTLTAGQLAALSVTFTDITPDFLLGTPLYTNPSQQGALQTNDQPPLAADMAFFNGMMFYANTQTLQIATVNMISVGAPLGIQIGDTVTVNGIIFTGAASQNNAAQQFLVTSGGTPAANIDATARSFIACVNANAAATNVYALYLSGYNSLPGIIGFRALTFTQAAFALLSSRGTAFNPPLPPSGTSFISSNDVNPNGLYASKNDQPEAVPAVNLEFVGGGDQPIFRILPLRDRLIVLKLDGVYVVTGSTPSTLSITLLDSTIILIAPESGRLLNNSVYCMSNQGVVSITESGVTIQSRAIEEDLIKLTSPAFPNFKNICHAISYESERLYILGMPTAGTDTYATQEYCYNWVTNAWTRWTEALSSGLVNPLDNTLYVGKPKQSATGIASHLYGYRERKNYDFSDFMDDQLTGISIVSVDATGLVLKLSLVPLISWIGLAVDQPNVGIAIITSVNILNSTVTVDIGNSTSPGIPIPWNLAAPVNIDEPIQVAITQTPLTAGFPHYMKDWGRVNFWFNAINFPVVQCGFASDYQGPILFPLTVSGSGYGYGPYGGGPYGGFSNYPQVIHTLVPAPAAKGHYIIPSLSMAFPQTRFSFLGVTASYEIDSDVSG